MERINQELREPVEISFGSKFTGSESIGGGNWVIIGLGGESIWDTYFCNAASYWYSEGKLIIGSVGSAISEHIGMMLEDNFSLGEIIEGMSNFMEGEPVPMERIRQLTKEAGRGSRMLREK